MNDEQKETVLQVADYSNEENARLLLLCHASLHTKSKIDDTTFFMLSYS